MTIQELVRELSKLPAETEVRAVSGMGGYTQLQHGIDLVLAHPDGNGNETAYLIGGDGFYTPDGLVKAAKDSEGGW